MFNYTYNLKTMGLIIIFFSLIPEKVGAVMGFIIIFILESGGSGGFFVGTFKRLTYWGYPRNFKLNNTTIFPLSLRNGGLFGRPYLLNPRVPPIYIYISYCPNI